MNNSEDDDIIRGKPFNETDYGLDALTRTDFLRELLEDAKNAAPDDNDLNNNIEADAEAVVKRRKKNKKGGRGSMEYYRTLDNRDKLPFEVRSTSPDPYTTGNQAKLRQKLLQQLEQEQNEANGGDGTSNNYNN